MEPFEGAVTELDPPRRFSFTWGDEHLTSSSSPRPTAAACASPTCSPRASRPRATPRAGTSAWTGSPSCCPARRARRPARRRAGGASTRRSTSAAACRPARPSPAAASSGATADPLSRARAIGPGASGSGIFSVASSTLLSSTWSVRCSSARRSSSRSTPCWIASTRRYCAPPSRVPARRSPRARAGSPARPRSRPRGHAGARSWRGPVRGRLRHQPARRARHARRGQPSRAAR